MLNLLRGRYLRSVALLFVAYTLMVPGMARASYVFENVINHGDRAFNQHGFYVNSSGATVRQLAHPVPEPAPYVMIGLAALLLGSLRLRKSSRR